MPSQKNFGGGFHMDPEALARFRQGRDTWAVKVGIGHNAGSTGPYITALLDLQDAAKDWYETGEFADDPALAETIARLGLD